MFWAGFACPKHLTLQHKLTNIEKTAYGGKTHSPLIEGRMEPHAAYGTSTQIRYGEIINNGRLLEIGEYHATPTRRCGTVVNPAHTCPLNPIPGSAAEYASMAPNATQQPATSPNVPHTTTARSRPLLCPAMLINS